MSAAAAKRTVLAAASIVAVVALSVIVPAGTALSGGRDKEPPTTPQNVRVTAAMPSLVHIAWDPSTDNVGVEGYYVFGDKGKATVAVLDDKGEPVLDDEGNAVGSKPEYTVRWLECGQSTVITVVAFDAAQNRSGKATVTVATAACGDTQPPTAPSGFNQIATSTDAVVLAWAASYDNVGVVEYGVYQNLRRVETPAEPTVTLTGLSCGSTYEHAVDAADAAGNRSPLVKAYVRTASCPSSGDTTPPSTPTGLAASSITQTGLTLSWRASSDNVGVTGYDVYRSGAKVASVSTTTASQGGLSCGTSYTFGVVARDAAGNASSQAQLTVSTAACSPTPPPGDTMPPSAPTGLAASSISQTSLTVSWYPSTDNVGVIGYDVYRSGTKTASVSSTSSNQAGLTCETSYVFAVVARDAAGNSSQPAQLTVSTAACSTPPPPSVDTTPPSQPTNLGISNVTRTSVSLSWSASTDNVGVEGYRIYVNGSWSSYTAQPGATVSNLVCGTAYTFAVDAFDAEGNSSARASVTGSTAACADTQAPTAPTNMVASSRTATSIALSWSASTDNVGVAGYGLYRGGAQVGTSSTTTGIFSGLTCNTNYTLAVDAYDAAGSRSSQTVVMVSTTACPDTTPPSAPTGLAASNVSQTGLILSWNASTDNVGVSGYRLFINGIQTGHTSSTSYPVGGLSCGTSYTLAVEAYDGAGNTSQRPILGASTTACPAATPSACSAGQFGAQYYADISLSGSPAITRCENAINYNWGSGGPGGSVPTDNFSARWLGTFDFSAGDTTFTAIADDGIRLSVDGVSLIDAWRDQPPTTYTATRTLTAGMHEVTVEYYEKASGAVAQLSWTTGSSTPPSAPPPPSAGRWFSDSSPWNAPIPSNPPVVSQSSSWINALYGAIGSININQGSWTPNVFTAGQSDPAQTMVNQDGWIVDSVPIPANLQPSSDSDAHAIILAPWLNRAYEFFGLRKDSTGKWTFYAADVIRLDGSGWWDGTYSAGGVTGPWGPRASGASLTGGLIRAQDAQAGVIPHALACAAPKHLIGPPVSPARTGDGSGGSGAMPMGSRLQLDPSLDLSSLGLAPGEEVIARALQTYGAYIVDSSSALACYAQSTSALGSNPYPSSWSDGIRRDLVLKMRIVSPPGSPTYDTRGTFGQPHR